MTTKKTGVDQELIRELAGILNDTDLTEIEVEQDDLRSPRVARSRAAVHAVAAPAPAMRRLPQLPPPPPPAPAAGRRIRERRDLADGRHRLSARPSPAPSPSSRSATRVKEARRS